MLSEVQVCGNDFNDVWQALMMNQWGIQMELKFMVYDGVVKFNSGAVM